MTLKLIFMGTPDFAVPALEALLNAGHEVVAVYSQPPRPANRGQKETPSPVHRFAESRGLLVRTPKSLKRAEEQEALRALGADAAVVAAYGLLLPKAVLDAPRLGCFNIHGSLLPRWRGAAPIQRAVLAGDPETGVTIMAMDEGLDTGAMALKGVVPIGPETTAAQLHDELSRIGADLMVAALTALEAGTLTFTQQPDEGATHAAKLSREDGRLDWAADAAQIDRQVRALTPWPGCWFDLPPALGGERIKVAQATPVTGSGAPGTLLDDQMTVACGAGAIRIDKAQRPGKAAVDGASFLRGLRLQPGATLS